MKTIHNKAYHHLIGFLKDRRRALGLRQHEVAAVIGMTRTAIGKIEQCERRLDVLETRQLCGALGLSLSHLDQVLDDYEQGLDEER